MLNIKKQIAEARLVERYPEIAAAQLQQIIADEQMKRGDVSGAIKTQQTQNLLQYGGNR